MVDYKRERVRAEIDLDRFAENVRNIKAAAGSKLLAVVKANAYGHGAVEAARVCLKNGADYLAVANIDEAIELREHGIGAPILILGYTVPERYEDVIKYDIIQTIYCREMADDLSKEAIRLAKDCRIHIKLDTGMGRIGFFPSDESINEIIEISRLPGINITGIFTHFAEADSKDKAYTHFQVKGFKYVTDALEQAGLELIRHCANSAAILDMMPELSFDMVRAGIILYGYYPSDEVTTSVKISPVMSLKSRVAFVKPLKSGSYVSYGRTYKASEDVICATVPVGYADGYFRANGNKARVIINGHFCPIIGRVCMDQFMVDVSHVPDVKMGDEVILMGESGDIKIDADELAGYGSTISYEILCAVSKRVPRIYIQNYR